MTEIFITQQPDPAASATIETPTNQQATQTPQPEWKKLLEKYKPVFLKYFGKFYSNKKIFWPVSIAIGLFLLVLIAGLLFGKKGGSTNPTPVKKLPTPTPFVRPTPNDSIKSGPLFEAQQKLDDLENQIKNFDVKQTRLQPPTINFEIRF